jgi:hypothetical protein
MDKPRLSTPVLRVVMADGSEHTVQAINIDMVNWDRDRAKHHWPLPADAPFVWLNYLAWHALTKTQRLLPTMTLREFEEQAIEVSSAAAEGAADNGEDGDDGDDGDTDDGEVRVDPTKRDPELG